MFYTCLSIHGEGAGVVPSLNVMGQTTPGPYPLGPYFPQGLYPLGHTPGTIPPEPHHWDHILRTVSPGAIPPEPHPWTHIFRTVPPGTIPFGPYPLDCIPRTIFPGLYPPPPRSWQAGSTYPPGMLSCYIRI